MPRSAVAPEVSLHSSAGPVLVLITALTLLVGGAALATWRLLRWSPVDELPAHWTVEDDEVALGLAQADLRERCPLPWPPGSVGLTGTSVVFDGSFATVEGQVVVEGRALPFVLRAERRPRFEGFDGRASWSVDRLTVSIPDGGTLRCGEFARLPAPAE